MTKNGEHRIQCLGRQCLLKDPRPKFEQVAGQHSNIGIHTMARSNFGPLEC